MDCRKTLGLGLCLLIGSAGCSHSVITGPSGLPASPSQPSPSFGGGQGGGAPVTVQTLPPGAVVRKAADQPARAPHASTCVAEGDWAAAEANAPDISDTKRREKRELARQAYRRALSIDSHYLPAYESLAKLYGDLKDHSHAVATYRQAGQMFPNEPRVFYELGNCYGSHKEWEPAIHSLARAVELDPENRQFVDTLGWMQARASRYDESLATFRKVHDAAEAHYRLALMLEHLSQPELCKQHLRAALETDPHQERARALLAQLNEAPTSMIQRAGYTESGGPRLTSVAPAAEEPAPSQPSPRVGGGQGGGRGQAVILPPPPRISIPSVDNAVPNPAE
jgi:Tfp pilus assembly protein PilF